MIDDKTLDKWEKRAKNYINFGESNLGRQDPNITVYECVQSHHALAAVIQALRAERKWSAELEKTLEYYSKEIKHDQIYESDLGIEFKFKWDRYGPQNSIGNKAREALAKKPKELDE